MRMHTEMVKPSSEMEMVKPSSGDGETLVRDLVHPTREPLGGSGSRVGADAPRGLGHFQPNTFVHPQHPIRAQARTVRFREGQYVVWHSTCDAATVPRLACLFTLFKGLT